MPKERPRMALALDPRANDYPPFFSVVVGNRIAGSGHPNKYNLAEQLQMLKERENIYGIMSLTKDGVDGDTVEAQGMSYFHLPVVDKTPPTIAEIARGSVFVDKVNGLGGAVLVHCREGIGRTGTMIAGWMMLSLGMSAESAIAYVRERRHGSIHQRHQELRLYQLERVCRDPASFKSISQGTFDEAQYDFCTLKAATSLLVARCNRCFLMQVYFVKLANFCKKQEVSEPKYLERSRSPFWKPKLGNFKAYLSQSREARGSRLSICSDKSQTTQGSGGRSGERSCSMSTMGEMSEWHYVQAHDVTMLVEDVCPSPFEKRSKKKIFLQAIREILHVRPTEPANFLSEWFKEKSKTHQLRRPTTELEAGTRLVDCVLTPKPPTGDDPRGRGHT